MMPSGALQMKAPIQGCRRPASASCRIKSLPVSSTSHRTHPSAALTLTRQGTCPFPNCTMTSTDHGDKLGDLSRKEREGDGSNGDSPFRGTRKQVAIALVAVLVAILLKAIVVAPNIADALLAASIMVAIFGTAILFDMYRRR